MSVQFRGCVVSVALRDEADNVAVKRFTLAQTDDTTPSTALTDAATLIGHLEALTDAAVSSYNVTFDYLETSPAPSADSEVENRALLALDLDYAVGQQAKATMEIPAPGIGLFVSATGPNKNVIDTSVAALLTFVADFAATTGIAWIADKQTIDSLVSGKRVHKASRKG